MSPHLQWCMFLPWATSHPVQRHAECLIILWRFNHQKNQKRPPPSCSWPQTESTAGIYVKNRQGREGTEFRNDWGDNDIWAQPQGSWPAESGGRKGNPGDVLGLQRAQDLENWATPKEPPEWRQTRGLKRQHSADPPGTKPSIQRPNSHKPGNADLKDAL